MNNSTIARTLARGIRLSAVAALLARRQNRTRWRVPMAIFPAGGPSRATPLGIHQPGVAARLLGGKSGG